jgi:hypothetical protein
MCLHGMQRENFTFYYTIMIQSTPFINEIKTSRAFVLIGKKRRKQLQRCKNIGTHINSEIINLLASFQCSRVKYGIHSNKT